MPSTVKTILEKTTAYFEQKGIETPRVDAEWLISHVLKCKRLSLYLTLEQPLHETELATLRELVRKRGQRVPLAYLLGECGFWDLILSITPAVLIPSPDTERLVECVIASIEMLSESDAAAPESIEPLKILELGAGSGAIGIAVCHAVNRPLQWLAVDNDLMALKVAATNVNSHQAMLNQQGHHLQLLASDKFSSILSKPFFDVIVSNPPYIPSDQIDSLMSEVSQQTPRQALDGGEDGGDFYRYLLAEGGHWLKPSGDLLLEIGADQAELVTEIGTGLGWAIPTLHHDWGDLPRVLHFKQK